MKIYLDVCCLNRPLDDQTQVRVRLESEAVVFVLSRIAAGEWLWFGSTAMIAEIKQTPDAARQQQVLLLTEHIDEMISITEEIAVRTKELEGLGFKAFDATHLACAEYGRADVFLTTDDRLLRRAKRLAKQLQIRVSNPLTWVQELTR